MVQAQGLWKSYRLGDSTVNALCDVSFTIHDGEFWAITGASGSGKTTLMNILGCLDQPDSGQYSLDNREISALSKNELAEVRNKRIGFVFQNFALLPRMSALENVELPLLYASMENSQERALDCLKIVGLQDRCDHEPNQLSGGQRQRVAIARAIAASPSLILADEPTGNLDSRTGMEILELFRSLNEKGMTFVIVTHDKEVAKNCSREISMRDGRIVEAR